MIVRDEADFLPQFLAKVDGAWDQLVALDTGSTDATRAILTAAGAEVHDFAWANDFSDARNACLTRATGDFILVLDADEMPQEGFVEELRACIATANVGAASIRIQSPMNHGHLHQSDILRLFRRDFEPRYNYRVHEEVATSVELSLMATGTDYVHLLTPVVHLGYDRDLCLVRNKKTRDTTLLWACVQEDATDLYSWYKLLEQGRFYKDEVLTQEAAQGALAAVDKITDTTAIKHFLPDMVVLLAEAIAQNQPQRAQSLLFYWADKLPNSPALIHARGQTRETSGDMDLAAQDFQACLNLDGQASNQQLTSVRPRLGLARIALARANLRDAECHIDASLALAPQDPEALLAKEFLTALKGPRPSASASRA